VADSEETPFVSLSMLEIVNFEQLEVSVITVSDPSYYKLWTRTLFRRGHIAQDDILHRGVRPIEGPSFLSTAAITPHLKGLNYASA